MLSLDGALYNLLLAMLRKVGQYNFQSTEESGPWPELSPDEFGSCSLERSANWRQCLPQPVFQTEITFVVEFNFEEAYSEE